MPGAPKRLRCEYLENPLGIDETAPRLSWWIDDEHPAEIQTAYHILAATDPLLLADDEGDLWDTGRVSSGDSCHIVYDGEPLTSRQRVWWKVKTYDSDGEDSAWSRDATFEMGLLARDDWSASWIGSPLAGSKSTPVQVPALRHVFELPQPAEKARLYVTALGLHQLEVNGRRVTGAELLPGWTDYRKRVRYQVFDVADLLVQGSNALGALLGDGWYCGFLGLSGRQQYGDAPALLVQLEVVLPDGVKVTVVSNEDWRWRPSHILYSDIFKGESVDARQLLGKWTAPDYDAQDWLPVTTRSADKISLDATMSPAIRAVDELQPIGEPSRRVGFGGERRMVFDLGQNMVGRVRLRLKAKRGTQVTLRYAERLDDAGELYTANLRTADATDHYTCRGGKAETFEPTFTFHGFQYVEVAGTFGEDAISELTGVVLSSSLEEVGEFQCDHPLLNQLASNVVWSQRGNFLDVPTDCPQRDERLGWTGDAQIFARTAAFNLDIASFMTKWLTDLSDAQNKKGWVPPVAPLPPALKQFRADGGPGWSDAIVICPWTLYRCFGDRRILERHYGAMNAFVDDLETRFPDLIRGVGETGWPGVGDWLAADGGTQMGGRSGRTPKDLIGTAMFCYSAQLLTRIAGVLGNPTDLERFDVLAGRIRDAFRRRFVTAEGRLVSETQTAYVLALHFGLLDDDEVDEAMAALVSDIDARDGHLSTGFIGTPYLLHVLTNYGRLDLAYRLLLQTSAPSWLYPVTQGATTVWERWDSWTEQDGFSDPAMNSFNHYAFGAVGEWLYGTMVGLELVGDLVPSRNAYRHALIRPRPPVGKGFSGGAPVRYASAGLDTVHGRYDVSWELIGGEFRLKVRIPPNCRASVVLPNGESRELPAGRHELSVGLFDLADDGIPVLNKVSDLAS